MASTLLVFSSSFAPRTLPLAAILCVLYLSICSAGLAFQEYPVVNTWIKGSAVAGVPPFRVAQSTVNVGKMYIPGETNTAYASVMFGGEGPGYLPGTIMFYNDTWILSRRDGQQPWWSLCESSSGIAPPGRNFHTMVPLGNSSVLLFGGFGYTINSGAWWPSMDDLWKLDANTCEWTNLTVTRQPNDPWPSPRGPHRCLLQQRHGRLWRMRQPCARP